MKKWTVVIVIIALIPIVLSSFYRSEEPPMPKIEVAATQITAATWHVLLGARLRR